MYCLSAVCSGIRRACYISYISCFSIYCYVYFTVSRSNVNTVINIAVVVIIMVINIFAKLIITIIVVVVVLVVVVI